MNTMPTDPEQAINYDLQIEQSRDYLVRLFGTNLWVQDIERICRKLLDKLPPEKRLAQYNLINEVVNDLGYSNNRDVKAMIDRLDHTFSQMDNL